MFLPNGLQDEGDPYRPLPNTPDIASSETVAARKGIHGLEMISSQLRQCLALRLKKSGDEIMVNGYALYQKAGQPTMAVGKIQEILVDHGQRRVVGVLVLKYSIGRLVLPYRFPSLAPAANLYEFLAYDVSFDSIGCHGTNT